MQRIEENYFTKFQNHGTIKLVQSVDYNCPECGRNVNFALGWSIPQVHLSLTTTSRCSGCGKISKFIYIDYDLGTKPEYGKLYIHPDSKRRSSIIDFSKTDSTLNTSLQKAYESALNVYNVGEWTATSVLCRRLLEGITQDLLPDENRKHSLYKRIADLPNHLDLTKPILTLADALRKGGNLGAHFDLENTPDKKIASQMLDLLDYLIEYIYILPKRIDNLHTEIKDLNGE
ncbi:MAG: DUF4145 domain-containing protein [Flavobacteriaceae bacterium]